MGKEKSCRECGLVVKQDVPECPLCLIRDFDPVASKEWPDQSTEEF